MSQALRILRQQGVVTRLGWHGRSSHRLADHTIHDLLHRDRRQRTPNQADTSIRISGHLGQMFSA